MSPKLLSAFLVLAVATQALAYPGSENKETSVSTGSLLETGLKSVLALSNGFMKNDILRGIETCRKQLQEALNEVRNLVQHYVNVVREYVETVKELRKCMGAGSDEDVTKCAKDVLAQWGETFNKLRDDIVKSTNQIFTILRQLPKCLSS